MLKWFLVFFTYLRVTLIFKISKVKKGLIIYINYEEVSYSVTLIESFNRFSKFNLNLFIDNF